MNDSSSDYELLQPGEDVIDDSKHRYKVVRGIGHGSFSEVYLVEDERYQNGPLRWKAIKIFKDSKLHDEERIKEHRKRFEKERNLQRSGGTGIGEHPNVVQVLDFGTHRGARPFHVMPFIQGISLSKYIRSNLIKSDSDIFRVIVTQIADAFECIHANKIFHRDLASHNILLKQDEQGNCLVKSSDFVNIIDFGFADDSARDPTTQITWLENNPEGKAAGNTRICSPERLKGKQKVTAQDDVFSFGALLYEMLSGETFHNETYSLVGSDGLLKDVAIPQEIKKVISTALAETRDARYKTMKEVVDALFGAMSDLNVEVFPGNNQIIPEKREPLDVSSPPTPEMAEVKRPGSILKKNVSDLYRALREERGRLLILVSVSLIVIVVIVILAIAQALGWPPVTPTPPSPNVTSPGIAVSLSPTVTESLSETITPSPESTQVSPTSTTAFSPTELPVNTSTQEFPSPTVAPTLTPVMPKTATPVVTSEDFGYVVNDAAGTTLWFAGETQPRESGFNGSPHDLAWSPDGKTLAYVIEDITGSSGIYLRDSGTDRMVSLMGRSCRWPTWSPNGNYILWSGETDLGSRLMRFDVRTRESNMLFHSFDDAWAPTWSPDGSQLAYLSGAEGVPVSLQLVAVQEKQDAVFESRHTQLLTSERLSLAAPAWSPDGQWLVVATAGGLCTVDINIPEQCMPLTQDASDAAPCFMPDGQTVLFQRGHNNNVSIYKIPFSGGNPLLLREGACCPVCPRN